MRHGSLFSGIGGFDLAAEWMGWENIFQVEIDKFCTKVLEKNFPNVKRYGDIKEFDGTKYRGTVDIISGGFPCQPFSHAGKRKGQADDRYLWPEMLRVISEVKPSFIVGENVAGLVSMENGKALDKILSDLEDKGYKTEQYIIPACAVGGWHRRDRIWIIAYNDLSDRMSISGIKLEGTSLPKFSNNGYVIANSNGKGLEGFNKSDRQGKKRRFKINHRIDEESEYAPNTLIIGQQRQGKFINAFNTTKAENGQTIKSKYGCPSNQWGIESSVGRVADGIPGRVDRLKGLGNAIVPQVAYEIFKTIEQFNKINYGTTYII